MFLFSHPTLGGGERLIEKISSPLVLGGRKRRWEKGILPMRSGNCRKGRIQIMLLRPLEEVRERISTGQVVAAFAGEILVGNCFFHPWSEDLVEICSLVVDKRFRRQGIGTSLIREVTSLSRKLYPGARIFCLTDSSDRPDTATKEFVSAGFRPVEKSALPDEVWGWCEIHQCPDWLAGKFPNCKCLAMVYQG